MSGGERPRSERGATAILDVRTGEVSVAALAAAVAELVAERLRGQVGEAAGYLNAEAAGRYICVSRRRIHELTSTGALVPDGRDGRTPLYLRQTLDDYVRRNGGRP